MLIFENILLIWCVSGLNKKTAINRNPTAFAITKPTSEISTEPFSAMADTTERIISPITSSNTAAPKMIFASLVLSFPRSLNTRAVIPTDVAVSVAPKNKAV